jgi:hypothetical protein
MNGFSAMQASQIQEELFHKGMLPASLGTLAGLAAVKLIQSHGMDDETLTRLAREFAHRFNRKRR